MDHYRDTTTTGMEREKWTKGKDKCCFFGNIAVFIVARFGLGVTGGGSIDWQVVCLFGGNARNSVRHSGSGQCKCN